MLERNAEYKKQVAGSDRKMMPFILTYTHKKRPWLFMNASLHK